MSIALDATSALVKWSNSGAEKTTSLTIGGGSNRAVIGFFSWRNAGVTTVKFNGVAMNLAKSKYNTSANSKRAFIYYLLEADLPSAGTYNFAVDPDAATYGGLFCLSLTGVAQSAPEATGEGSNDSSVASWANNITTLTDGAWIFDCNCTGTSGNPFAPDSGQTELFDSTDTNVNFCGSYKSLATAGLTTMGQTPNASDNYAQAIAAFAPFVETVGGGNFFPYF